MAIIQDNDQYIENLVKKYTDLSKKAAKDLGEYEQKIQDALVKKFEDRRKEAQTRIANLERQGIILNLKEQASLQRQYQQAALQDKLDTELRILKQVSAASEKEREAENKLLQLKVNIQKAINADIEDENKKQELIINAKRELMQEENSQAAKRLEAQKKQNKEDRKNFKEENKEKARTAKEQQRQNEKENQQQQGDAYEFGDKFFDAFSDFRKEINQGAGATVKGTLEEDLLKGIKAVGKAITEGLDEINNSISSYAKYQTTINSRLQGVSSFSSAVDTLSDVAFSPLIKAEDLYSNLGELVHQGIVTNVEQRAFFQTVKDGIAETFDVNSASLRRLIRIQQNDSTAARLGMEGYLNKFLNAFVENTEYLTSTFDNVADALLEASALMSTQDSTEFEYVVQKWLGTLSGVGLSDNSAQSIADAIGKIGAGDIDVLNSEVGVLLTMSAARIGRSIGDMLSGGLDANETNDLLKSMVEYLQEISDNSNNNNVVKSQLAKIFGVTVSDLAAVGNLLKEDLTQAYGAELNYAGMYSELSDQFRELKNRMGIANILDNLFSNLTYQTGMNIGSSPALFATWKITDMIGKATGGINIPYISALGNGIDLNATVDGLMKLGIVGLSTISQIGDIINGVSSIGDPTKLLDKLGVSANMTEVKRGEGFSKLVGGRRKSGTSESEVIYVGTNDSSAYADSALNAAKEEAQEELDRKVEEYKDPVVEYLAKEVELKEKLEDIIRNQESSIDALTKNLTSMTAVVATMSEEVLGVGGATSAVQAISGVSSISSIENEIQNNLNNAETIATTVGGATTLLHSEATKYLEDMEFSQGFQKLVNDVSSIYQKMDKTISYSSSGSNVGLTNGMYSGSSSSSGKYSQSGGSQYVSGFDFSTLTR